MTHATIIIIVRRGSPLAVIPPDLTSSVLQSSFYDKWQMQFILITAQQRADTNNCREFRDSLQGFSPM